MSSFTRVTAPVVVGIYDVAIGDSSNCAPQIKTLASVCPVYEGKRPKLSLLFVNATPTYPFTVLLIDVAVDESGGR